MKTRGQWLGLMAACVLMVGATQAQAAVRITEWMYQGADGEFIEFTNTGPGTVDFTDWSYDDSSPIAGTIDLSSYGVVQPGESVLLIEPADVTAFRTAWGLAPTVKVIGGNAANLGRADEINLFDSSDLLVDKLTYGDQTFPGTIRTQNISGITTPANWGTNNVAGWFFSANGDGYGSYLSALGDTGSPGSVAVPEPASVGLIAMLGLAIARRSRRA